MKHFWISFALCYCVLFASCRVLDSLAGGIVKPKEPVNHGMTIDEYAEWYNEHSKDNPGLLDPSKEAEPEPAEPVAPIAPVLPDIVSSSDFEPTIGGKLIDASADAAPFPFASTAGASLITLASIYSAYRHNSRKNKQIKSMVEAVDKEGTDELKELIEKKVTREGVSGDLHKVVKVVKVASALAKLAKLEIK